jgi:hypothetical protein
MTNQRHTPRPTVDTEAISVHLNAAYQRLTPVALWTAIADIPVMLAELERLPPTDPRTAGPRRPARRRPRHPQRRP